mmetsp:Transcript_63008/g.199432  ORF Transcript_63008/g.199432 Transcript_63008/m.199432 type:complete len:273 (+) Transcript_63008:98-916(+)|eukprot:CAMPEP_0182910064 /NCGR_PEP_ID=MMETSP0034_2-20130328/36096_1 /TAXON_ID=156128 /ORGANISM="Nephroselmis pyriformis, Strain CCMP717" /LENGTH=272 /DNA_ID=CAMNT_0025046361 /DNA_START=215 /DNA_END=1033 /DNA_ORIENTATION=+
MGIRTLLGQRANKGARWGARGCPSEGQALLQSKRTSGGDHRWTIRARRAAAPLRKNAISKIAREGQRGKSRFEDMSSILTIAGLLLLAVCAAGDAAANTFYVNEVTGKTQNEFPQWYQIDSAGTYYYIDPATGQSTYNLPSAYAWSTQADSNGSYYYYNSVTGQSTYDKPEFLAWKVMSYYWYNEAMGHSQYEVPVWEMTDDNGYKYYLDPHTQQVTYDKPVDYCWEAAVDASGVSYYYNTKTAAATYDKPWFLSWTQITTEIDPTSRAIAN